MARVSQRLRALVALAALGAGVARAQGEQGEAQPAAEPPPTEWKVVGDFDRVNPGIGFGWFGVSDIPIGTVDGVQSVSAPVVGVRWWLGRGLGPFRAFGIDLGFGIGRDSTEVAGAEETRTGLLLHAGLPLVVSASDHVAVEIVPELNAGLSTGGDAASGDLSGYRFDVGTRAGAEVFFGFMGLPRLSLEASVGLFLSFQNAGYRPQGGTTLETSRSFFGTQRFSDPWDVFRGTVAARYYF